MNLPDPQQLLPRMAADLKALLDSRANPTAASAAAFSTAANHVSTCASNADRLVTLTPSDMARPPRAFVLHGQNPPRAIRQCQRVRRFRRRRLEHEYLLVSALVRLGPD